MLPHQVRSSVPCTVYNTRPFSPSVHRYPGGLYAVSVSRDGDGESHEKVRDKVAKWLANTNFVPDNTRALMGHMIYVDEEIKEGLGYHQMNLYTPIKLKKDSITGATGLC